MVQTKIAIIRLLLSFDYLGIPNDLAIFLRSYILLISTALINLLALELIDLLAVHHRFKRYSELEKYIMVCAFIYLTINMIIMPGIRIGRESTNENSLITSFYKDGVTDAKQYINSVFLKESGNILTNQS